MSKFQYSYGINPISRIDTTSRFLSRPLLNPVTQEFLSKSKSDWQSSSQINFGQICNLDTSTMEDALAVDCLNRFVNGQKLYQHSEIIQALMGLNNLITYIIQEMQNPQAFRNSQQTSQQTPHKFQSDLHASDFQMSGIQSKIVPEYDDLEKSKSIDMSQESEQQHYSEPSFSSEQFKQQAMTFQDDMKQILEQQQSKLQAQMQLKGQMQNNNIQANFHINLGYNK